MNRDPSRVVRGFAIGAIVSAGLWLVGAVALYLFTK